MKTFVLHFPSFSIPVREITYSIFRVFIFNTRNILFLPYYQRLVNI
jgi:hypothetical protein